MFLLQIFTGEFLLALVGPVVIALALLSAIALVAIMLANDDYSDPYGDDYYDWE